MVTKSNLYNDQYLGEIDFTNITRRPITCKPGDQPIFSRRNDRNITVPKSRFSVKVFYNTRKNKKKTHFRLPKTKQIHSGRTLQDGGSTCSKGNYRTKRLYLQNRFEGCLCGHSHTQGFNGLFDFRKSRHSLQVSFSRIWAKRISKSFQQNNAICYRTIKKRRNQANLLLGRYLRFIKDEGRDAQIDRENQDSSGSIGIHNQLLKEHTNTFKDTGILRVHLQHQNNEDFSTATENQQYTEKNQTGQEDEQHFLSMDSRTIGENNVYDSCDRGSPPPHQVSTETSRMGTPNSSSELGNELQVVLYQPPRIRLVGNISRTEERSTDPKNNPKNASNTNLCRCVEYWMGNQLDFPQGIGILESRRDKPINKRTRTEDHTLCLTTSCKKL